MNKHQSFSGVAANITVRLQLHVDQAALAGFWSVSSRIRSRLRFLVTPPKGISGLRGALKPEGPPGLTAAGGASPPGAAIRAANSEIRPEREDLGGLDARRREVGNQRPQGGLTMDLRNQLASQGSRTNQRFRNLAKTCCKPNHLPDSICKHRMCVCL